MLVRFENVSYTTCHLLVIVLIQLFTSFGALNAIELPLELLHVDGGVNIPKSMDYARRMAFPLASSDVDGGAGAGGVEMPPNVEDNMDFINLNAGNSNDNDEHDDIDDDLTAKAEMAKWLQMQMQQEHQHVALPHHHFQKDPLNHRNPMQTNKQHTQHLNHHHSNRQIHHPTTSATSSTVSPLRRCSIEISSKIPGICQSMGSIGNACVSGDYIDVFNAECL